MPANTGTPPPYERVDILMEYGIIARGIDPTKWDWRLKGKCAGIPIKSWQPSKE